MMSSPVHAPLSQRATVQTSSSSISAVEEFESRMSQGGLEVDQVGKQYFFHTATSSLTL